MQGNSTTVIAEGSDEAAKAANLAENNARTKIKSDGHFQNIFKFVQFVFEAACKNAELFSSKFSFIKLKY